MTGSILFIPLIDPFKVYMFTCLIVKLSPQCSLRTLCLPARTPFCPLMASLCFIPNPGNRCSAVCLCKFALTTVASYPLISAEMYFMSGWVKLWILTWAELDAPFLWWADVKYFGLCELLTLLLRQEHDWRQWGGNKGCSVPAELPCTKIGSCSPPI